MNDNNKVYLSPVSEGININASSQKVWEVISKPSNLESCHPFCESNPVEKWSKAKSVDFVNYYNGLKFKRIFIDWIDGYGNDLMIGKINGRKSKVIWRINEIDNLKSQLTITVYPHNTKRYPFILKSLVYFFYINPMLRKYLSSVLKGFQWHIEQGKSVQKNQFGNHKWFSN